MTRDAIVTTKPQINQTSRRSNHPGRRQREDQSYVASVSPGMGVVTNEMVRVACQEATLPQLRRSPVKKGPHQNSSQYRQNSENRSPTFDVNSKVVTPQRGGRRATGFSPTNFFLQPYFPMASSVTNVQRQRCTDHMPSTYFAGSKFGDAPSPAILPPPPPHWLSDGPDKTQSCRMSADISGLLSKEDHCIGLTSGLKVLLHVQ